jgi:hypothetical protein
LRQSPDIILSFGSPIYHQHVLGLSTLGAKMGEKRVASASADISSDEDQPIKPPPPKRTKYVSFRIKTERPTDRRHRRDDPNSTFDIYVGESQRLFTLNEDFFTQRSKFLRNGREKSKRWWRRNKAKMLADEDPEVFSSYVDTVRFGVGFLWKRIRSDTLVDSGFQTDEEEGTEKHLDGKEAKTAKFLVDLYLLAAEKLLDPVAANCIINVLADSLGDGGEHKVKLLFAITPHVYASTANGSPLRMLVRDTFISTMYYSWAEDAQARGLPYELLQDFAIGIGSLQTWCYPSLKRPRNSCYHIY